MEFRIKARISAILVVAVCVAAGQDVTVRHRHLYKGAPGELRVTTGGNSSSKRAKAASTRAPVRSTIFKNLELSPDTLRILTYEDSRWELGRDREYLFDHRPSGFAKSVYVQWRNRLDRRFIADLADNDVVAELVIPGKRLGAVTGSQGALAFGEDRIVYQSARPEQSRTWRFADV